MHEASHGLGSCLLWRRGWPGLVLMAVLGIASAHAACPKLLIFDGPNIPQELNTADATYWGQTVGMEGSFIQDLMNDWHDNVGSGPDSQAWQWAKNYQDLYSQYGVTDNFVKAAIYFDHNWNDASANAYMVNDFKNAAAMAKYTGFKGMALDFEPYASVWDGPSSLASAIYNVGRSTGQAMLESYPSMTLFVIADVLYQINERHSDEYKNSIHFLEGLLSAGFSHVVIGIETTYSGGDIAETVQQTLQEYQNWMQAQGLPPTDLSIAPGLWPLGRTYHDKSARMSPSQFEELLRSAYSVAPDYVWIYGHGSAWQTDGRFEGEVAKRFKEYTAVVHRVRAACTSGSQQSGRQHVSGKRWFRFRTQTDR